MFGIPSGSLNITAELLGLPDVKVIDVHTNLLVREITIAVESTRNTSSVVNVVSRLNHMV
ncbi:hypothetical protein HWV03_16400 [Moritella sp. 36]|uniref:hypothetical protein n=1 Tax=Moritella sp. 36 TaxID=2746233 RepID=UPI001BA91E8B|nr:hypothetical protein [Moritella sp. 36]QUM90267.1 hypothetical protein HWV03_16400 [Moritella sp. 36]